jgi:hypothetical protein
MFEWKYTTKAYADPPFQEYDYINQCYKTDENGNPVIRQWKSYDNKFVRKHEVKKLPERMLVIKVKQVEDNTI